MVEIKGAAQEKGAESHNITMSAILKESLVAMQGSRPFPCAWRFRFSCKTANFSSIATWSFILAFPLVDLQLSTLSGRLHCPLFIKAVVAGPLDQCMQEEGLRMPCTP